MSNIEPSEIVSNLIHKHFPRLKNKQIIIKYVKAKNKFNLMQSRRDINYYYILINSNIKNRLSIKAFKGVLTHELFHLDDFAKKGIIWYFWIMFLIKIKNYNISKNEKFTDKRVVLLGYGEELLQFKKERKSLLKTKKEKIEFEKRTKKYYLEDTEIRKLMKF